MRPPSRRGLVALVALWLLNLVRWARHTRPEPLPAPPVGSTTVLADDGTRLHAQVAGRPDSDLTMVFVHGFLARTLEWDMQVNHFSDRARLIRYDHRNHGRSGSSRRTIDVRTLARDLACVVEPARPDRPGRAGRPLHGRHDHAGAAPGAARALPRARRGRRPGRHRSRALHRRAPRREPLANLLGFRLLAPVLEQVRHRGEDLVPQQCAAHGLARSSGRGLLGIAGGLLGLALHTLRRRDHTDEPGGAPVPPV